MKKIQLFIYFVAPVFAYAQVTDVASAEALVLDLLTRLNYLLWLVAIAAFFWGIAKFIMNANDPKAREEGKKFMIWGVISFLVLVSIWAFVSLVLFDTLGLTLNPSVPYIDSQGNTY